MTDKEQYEATLEDTYIKISEEEAEELECQGVAIIFDCLSFTKNGKLQKEYAGFGGYFEARENGREDIILIVRNEGYFMKKREE